jgi:hypothetical protein
VIPSVLWFGQVLVWHDQRYKTVLAGCNCVVLVAMACVWAHSYRKNSIVSRIVAEQAMGADYRSGITAFFSAEGRLYFSRTSTLSQDAPRHDPQAWSWFYVGYGAIDGAIKPAENGRVQSEYLGNGQNTAWTYGGFGESRKDRATSTWSEATHAVMVPYWFLCTLLSIYPSLSIATAYRQRRRSVQGGCSNGEYDTRAGDT